MPNDFFCDIEKTAKQPEICHIDYENGGCYKDLLLSFCAIIQKESGGEKKV